MTKKHLLLFIGFLLSYDFYGQNKVKLFIDNFNRNEYNASIANWSTRQDNQGLLYFANYDGLLIFDGKNWEIVSLNSNEVVYSLAINNNQIFIGSQNDFGFLTPNNEGKLVFKSLKSKLPNNYPINKIFSITPSIHGICFVSNDAIFVWKNNEIEIIESNKDKFNHYLQAISNKGYIIKRNIGIVDVFSKPQSIIEGSDLLSKNLLIFILNKKNGDQLIGTSSDGFFLLKNNQLNQIPPSSLEPLIKKYTVLSFQKIPDGKNNSFAFSTSKGKGIIITKNINEVQYIIDKQNGLQSDVIRSVYFDNHKNLWAATQNGISKVEILSRWKYWDLEKEDIGTPWNLIKFKEKLYIGTSKGLYFLDNENPFIIKDITSKVWSLSILNKKLYAGSFKGLFAIDMATRYRISNIYGISKTFEDVKTNSLIVGHLFGISKIELINNKEKETLLLKSSKKTFNDINKYNSDLWVSVKFTGLYKISEQPSNTPKTTLYNTKNGLKDVNQISIIKKDDHILFCTDNGIYKYIESNPDSIKFSPDSTIIKERVSIKIAKKDSFGNFWFAISENRKQHIEKLELQKDGSYKRVFIPFRRLPEASIIDIYPEKDSVVWFATSSGLYRYDPKISKDYTLPFNTHIRKTISSDSVIFYGHYYDPDKNEEVPSILYEQPEAFKPTLTFDNNNITFEYSATFFEVPEKNQFSYYLENNDKHWSHWSTSTKKEYNNLSAGKYRFHVKSKNIYDTIGKTATYEFTVLPPWYQTAWAYLLFTISGLMFVALVAYVYSHRIRMQRRKLKLVVADRTFEVLSQKKEIEQQHQLLKSKNEEIKSQSRDIQKKNQQLENHQEEILTINSMLTEMNATLERTVERRTSKIKSTLKILQKTNNELDTFVYRASHDLKGPISRIIGLISLIKYEARKDTKYGQYFDLIESNTEEMEVLLSKLTEVHEIFNKEVQRDEISFNELIIETRTKFLSLENAHPTEFNYDLDKNSNFKSDNYILSVILSKVLENALTFRKSPNDIHKIEIYSTRRGRIFHFKIKDNGDGIEDEIKGKVYDMFFRGSEKSKGNGLGLYIVKMSLEKLGGKISLKTEANSFTEFTISIPVR